MLRWVCNKAQGCDSKFRFEGHGGFGMCLEIKLFMFLCIFLKLFF
jgi:hypothetical protein